MHELRHDAQSLCAFATSLLQRAGVRDDIARDVAEVLVDADLMGHTTHGLALLAAYLDQLAKGAMRPSGEPLVVTRHPASQLWDAQRLPGPWVTRRAFDRASAMAGVQGTATIVIRRSHHIACLAAYLPAIV
ncbi:MAG: Ldh family oxidoreductase, partial [Casimicrobiaceae bacterium]